MGMPFVKLPKPLLILFYCVRNSKRVLRHSVSSWNGGCLRDRQTDVHRHSFIHSAHRRNGDVIERFSFSLPIERPLTNQLQITGIKVNKNQALFTRKSCEKHLNQSDTSSYFVFEDSENSLK